MLTPFKILSRLGTGALCAAIFFSKFNGVVSAAGLTPCMQANTTESTSPVRVQQLLEAKSVAVSSHNPDAIIEASRAVIGECLSALASARALNNDHAEAAKLYKTSLATVPSSRTQLHLAEELLASGDREAAKLLAADVLEKEPTNAWAAALIGDLRLPPDAPSATSPLKPSLVTEGRWRRDLAGAYNDWGTAVVQQQADYAGAILLFQAAAHWDSTAPGTMLNLGLAAFRLRRFEESAKAFQSALDADPANPRIELLLGFSLFSIQKFSEAAAEFARVPVQAEADTHAAYEWAFSLAHISEPLQADRLIDEIVERPMQPEDLFLVCQVYEQTENYQHAIACLNKAATQAPSLPRVHASLGMTLIHLSRPADAVLELRKELALNPADIDSQFYLAYALLQVSQKPEAQQILVAVVGEQPGNGEAQYQLGKLLAEQAKWADAIDHLRAAAALQPANYDIHYQLQIAYRKSGQQEEAARELALYKSIKDSARAR